MNATNIATGARPRIRAKDLVRQLGQGIARDRLLGLAGETAFFVVLSLFPGLLIAAGLLSVLEVIVGADLAAAAEKEVTDVLEATLTSQAAGTVQSVKDVFQGDYGGLLTFATAAALVTIAGAWTVLINALNLAYDAVEQRTWVHRQLLGLGLGIMTVVVVVLALAVVVVGPLFGRGEELADWVGLGSAFAVSWDVLRLPLLFLGVTVWLMLVFHVAPARHTAWRHAIPGALTTALLWLVATAGFHLYLRLVGDRNPVLGAFGGGAILMMWVYLLNFALLLGGELNAILSCRRDPSCTDE